MAATIGESADRDLATRADLEKHQATTAAAIANLEVRLLRHTWGLGVSLFLANLAIAGLIVALIKLIP
ncbi:MAG: hypothetical protein OXG46_07775 [Chloroflexi bacterium]|nr:hypothetical protein [Chloroflexota bacterium]MCY3938818.1 hypothetical protein [Chloroflexota bacterium]